MTNGLTFNELAESRVWMEFPPGTKEYQYTQYPYRAKKMIKTYTINGKPLCLRKLKNGRFCKQPAGARTEHLGTGRCWLHGGRAGRTPIHGRRSEVSRYALRRTYENWLDDPNRKELDAELTVLRLLLSETLEEYEGAVENERRDALDHKLDRRINVIKNLESSQSRIANSHTLTAASAKLMMARAVDTMRQLAYQWFDDKDVAEAHLRAFIETWRTEVESLMPGGK